MLLGAHESTAGGLHEAFARGVADGAESLQIFTRSSRMWKTRPLTPEDIALFRGQARATALGPATSVHASYLINLGTDDGVLRDKSLSALIDELDRCDALGIPTLVIHPGSHPNRAHGLRNVSRALDAAFAAHRGACVVLLETAAGQGNALGATFEELRVMRDACRSPERVAFCLDTCHVFAAGYDLSTDAAYDATFLAAERILGLERILAFHLNDSKKPLGSRVDRHEHVCEGAIGPRAFERLVADERFAGVPGFLEIPPEGNRPCLDRLKAFRLVRAPKARPEPRPKARNKARKSVAGGARVAPVRAAD